MSVSVKYTHIQIKLLSSYLHFKNQIGLNMKNTLMLTTEELNLKIAEWMASGKSMKLWCKEQNFPYYAFRYRFRQARNKFFSGLIDRSSFVELESCQNFNDTGIEIHINNIVLKLTKNFDSDTLARFLNTIQGDSCYQ